MISYLLDRDVPLITFLIPAVIFFIIGFRLRSNQLRRLKMELDAIEKELRYQYEQELQ